MISIETNPPKPTPRNKNPYREHLLRAKVGDAILIDHYNPPEVLKVREAAKLLGLRVMTRQDRDKDNNIIHRVYIIDIDDPDKFERCKAKAQVTSSNA